MLLPGDVKSFTIRWFRWKPLLIFPQQLARKNADGGAGKEREETTFILLCFVYFVFEVSPLHFVLTPRRSVFNLQRNKKSVVLWTMRITYIRVVCNKSNEKKNKKEPNEKMRKRKMGRNERENEVRGVSTRRKWCFRRTNWFASILCILFFPVSLPLSVSLVEFSHCSSSFRILHRFTMRQFNVNNGMESLRFLFNRIFPARFFWYLFS